MIPGLGRSPGEGKGFSLQYAGLENSMDSTAHGVTKSWTQLSNFQFSSLHTLFMYKNIFLHSFSKDYMTNHKRSNLFKDLESYYHIAWP